MLLCPESDDWSWVKPRLGLIQSKWMQYYWYLYIYQEFNTFKNITTSNSTFPTWSTKPATNLAGHINWTESLMFTISNKICLPKNILFIVYSKNLQYFRLLDISPLLKTLNLCKLVCEMLETKCRGEKLTQSQHSQQPTCAWRPLRPGFLSLTSRAGQWVELCLDEDDCSEIPGTPLESRGPSLSHLLISPSLLP